MPTIKENQAPERGPLRALLVPRPTGRPSAFPVRAVAAALPLGAAATMAVVVLSSNHSPYGTVPAALAVALALWALVCGRRARGVLAWPLTALAVLSVVTAFARPRPIPESAGGWKLVEVCALLGLIAAVACRSPRREAVVGCAAGGVAVALWPIPFVHDTSVAGQAQAVLFWGVAAVTAAAAGAYPRLQAQRGRRAVAAARREQQLELARDLHDFVAHDVSAIVVQAQAARFVAEHDPQAVVLALERIEKAGLNALASMDRTVQMLHDADGAPIAASEPAGIAELPDLVERFSAERDGRVEADIGPGTAERLSREAGAVAYRVVVEALTNVRRHASASSQVNVSVRGDAAGLRLAVTNDGAVPARAWTGVRRRGGRGLVGLRERVAAVGGVLDAGPDGSGGWRVTAYFPDQA